MYSKYTPRFKTEEEAEDYFWSNLAQHNEDERGRDIFLENLVISGDLADQSIN